MTDARCVCGAVALAVKGRVGAFFPAKAVEVSGAPKSFTRVGASGGKVRSHFCSDCGSTLFWEAERAPGLIGVAIGAFADRDGPAPVLSVFERSKHAWAGIDGDGVEHFPAGRLQPPAP